MFVGSLLLCIQLGATLALGFPGPSYEDLPSQSLFPGPWDDLIQAPRDKSYIRPKRIWKQEGDVSIAEAVLESSTGKHSLTIRPGGLVTLEFPQNIGGRVCFVVNGFINDTFVALSYSESPTFADGRTDATTDQERDLNLLFPIKHNGVNCVGKNYNRGGFKYLTIFIPGDGSTNGGFWHSGIDIPKKPIQGRFQRIVDGAQKFLGYQGSHPKFKAELNITSLWVNCTAFPSNPNPRAYTGYFDSSSSMLNRVWYAGAYTLQLSTLDPNEGSSIIDYNRRWDHNVSPSGAWYSNFTIANGTAVTTDGAKRDRMVWPGDMSIAVPGIAVSTYDMIAVRNALNTLFDHQYGDGSLPYAGPPMGGSHEFSDTYHLHTLLGAYNYVIYSGDLNWLLSIWDKYIVALEVSIAKVDEIGLLHVTSTADWLRPGMTGHNGEVSAIAYDVLLKSVKLAHFIGDDRRDAQPYGLWANTAAIIKANIDRIYCARAGLYADNIGRRNCGGSEEMLPQDGNSWAILTGLVGGTRAYNISMNLRKRWGKYGAPAVEYPNVISPFASSFELIGHCVADNHDAAIELMEFMWGYMLDGPHFTNSTCVEGYRTDGDVQYPAYWAPSRNSHSHGWSSGPTMVLLTEILGIHLDSPLGRTWHITPHVTKWLSYVQGGFATKMGKFEVKLKRMVDSTGRKAEVLDVNTPAATTGNINWGGAIISQKEGGRFRFARMLDTPGHILDLTDPSWASMSDDEYTIMQEGWAKASVGDLKFDEEWVKPAHEEREPGVVDWEALEKNYHLGRPYKEW